jgi:hypothetical protein
MYKESVAVSADGQLQEVIMKFLASFRNFRAKGYGL